MCGAVPPHPYMPLWSVQGLYLFTHLKSVPVRGQTGTWPLYDPEKSFTLLEVRRREVGGGGVYKDAYICFHISLRQGLIFYKLILLLLLPLALQPTVGFGLSNNVLPFFPIYHQLSPSSHSHHLKISFSFLFPSFPGSSPSSRPFQFLSEELFGHPILLHSL